MYLRFLFALFILIAPTYAWAADEVAPHEKHLKIAVVDIQQLMSVSKAAKSIQSQGKKLRDKYQKKIIKIEKNLKSAEEKLVKLPKDTTKEEFLKKRKSFQKKLVDGQKEVQDLNKKLDKALGKALNKLRDKIVKIVGDISTDEKFDLVISRADVVIVSKKIDITAMVMKKLNKALSKISVKG